MKEDREDHAGSNDIPTDFDRNPFNREQQQQAAMDGFDHEDAYEEPDRDTDFSSVYREEDLDSEAFDDLLAEDSEVAEEELLEEDDELLDEPEAALEPDFPEPTPAREWNVPREQSREAEPWMTDTNTGYGSSERTVQGLSRLPMGLLAVAALALVLLIAGGYGVIQQRAESEEEIRRLRAALATSATPEELRSTREAAQVLERENTELIARNNALQTEAGRLIRTISDLETQLIELEATNVAGTRPEAVVAARPAPKPAPKPTPKPAPKPVPKPEATAKARPEPPIVAPSQAASKPQVASTASGDWFVNFSSYGESAVAESWKNKLKPGSGQVITAPSEKNGKTYYRVRVVGLADRASAERVARALEKEYGLPKLWVGKQ